MSDPLGTGGLRAAALAAWTAHPARLREDANAEEDHARGHYRDRVVVELAQNAADAAVRAGRPGHLLLRLTTGPVPVLVAANTGAPLDAAGLASLASLRASAKRDAPTGPGPAPAPTVGRFGVGFAAVRSVADEVAVVSRSGGVHFSLAATAALLAGESMLTAEVGRRAGSLPALRLPFAGVGPAVGAALRGDDAPGGDPSPDLLGEQWDTAVVLVLRDDDAVAQVRAQLAAVGDPLLLALPGLDRVTVDVDGAARVLEHVADRWVVATGAGELPAALLATRPVEERERPGWQVTWAVPRTAPTDPAAPPGGPAAPPAGGVVHAPTPTDEPCTVPALLVATLPLDPARRHVATGPVTDAVVAHAGPVWADLLLACRAERADGRPAPDPLDLVPRGWPAGQLDAALREAVLAATATAPVLTAPDGTAVAPRDAVVLEAPWTCDDGAARLLGPWVPALVRLADTQRDLVRVLGLRTVGLGAVIEQLPGTPALLRGVCELVATAGPDVLAELATAPVPLVDGRVVHGVRGLVLADAPQGALDALVGWGLRVVHPDADHPVLERLGAQRLDAAALARHPVLRERILDGDEDAAAVLLALVAAAAPGGAAEVPSWWGEALLDAQDGDLVPARGLVLPGSPAAAWFDPAVLPPVADELVARWGAALEAVGVRRGLVVERVDELVADGLDGWADYLDATGLPSARDAGRSAEDPGSPGAGDEVPLAVADLDAVRPEAWPAVLAELARAHRHAMDPVRGPVRRPPYTAWWLRHRADLGLDRPFALRPGTVPGLDPVPTVLAGLDEALLRSLGGVGAAADLDAEGWVGLLDGLLDAGAAVDLPLAVELWRALARLVQTGTVALAPLAEAEALPALVAGAAATAGVSLAPTDDVAVADPMWAQHPLAAPVVVVPAALTERVADALDLDLAVERATGRVSSTGRPVPVPPALRTLAGLVGAVPETWYEHRDLRVDGEGVAWWVVGDEVHAGGPDGLASGVAHLLGWRHRDRFARVLADPAVLAGALVDLAGDGEPGT